MNFCEVFSSFSSLIGKIIVFVSRINRFLQKYKYMYVWLSKNKNNVKLFIFFVGVDGMGLFWSMIPDPDQQKGQRYMKRDVTTPQVIHLSVFNGHHSWNDFSNMNLNPIISKELRRWFKHKSVTREEIRYGKLRGTLFIPSGMLTSGHLICTFRYVNFGAPYLYLQVC